MAFCFFLNHLLRREEWARRKLAPFAGATVKLSAPPLPDVMVTIREDGLVAEGSATGEQPALHVKAKPGVLAALGRGEEHLARAVEVSGDARLAAEAMALVRHLRWEPEEDLSRLLGDVAAHRLAEAGRAFLAWQGDALERLGGALAAYATDEKRVLVRRADLAAHGEDLARLRDALERLDLRIRRLG